MSEKMDPGDVVEINGVKYYKEGTTTPQPMAGRGDMDYVIVRCRDAGVHAGYLQEQDDRNGVCVLVDSRRLWRWHGRTLSGLALEGTDDVSKCKFGDTLPEITLRGWSEIIPCTEIARESLVSVARWVNNG